MQLYILSSMSVESHKANGLRAAGVSLDQIFEEGKSIRRIKSGTGNITQEWRDIILGSDPSGRVCYREQKRGHGRDN